MNIRSVIVIFVLTLCCPSMAHAQARNSAYNSYIAQYSAMAVDQMNRYHIPASITLAQGLLESGAGKSSLAVYSNNHFGIKCGSAWTGKKTYKDDDAADECFRVYASAAESYEDHSKFLQKERYKRLFSLSLTDYKGWAKGLKECGYATSPTYASSLISIIETYELYKYDSKTYTPAKPSGTTSKTEYAFAATRTVRMVNDRPCVTLQEGDSWQKLSAELGISRRKLVKYNEALDYIPTVGTNIFLKTKGTKAEKKYTNYWHKVKKGETMYSISQLYGVKVKTLYKINYKSYTYEPPVGEIIKIR